MNKNPALTPTTATDSSVFLSTLPAGPRDYRLALGVLLVSALIFLAAAPFARHPLSPVPAFLPAYQSAVVICELITAVLLLGQFGILRSRRLLVLACAYLFSAFMAVAHAFSFPGLFTAGGLMGAGPQTTAWLYFFWHGGFPLLILAYALLGDKVPDGRPAPGLRNALLGGLAVLAAAIASIVLFTTAGHDLLPRIMTGNTDASTKLLVAVCTWALSFLALGALWRQRVRSVIDLWLMVVMCVWIFEIALAAVLNGARFDVGWYIGRVYGLLASSFVLMVLLLENSMLYIRLVEANASDRRKSAELEELNKDLESFSYSVSHDLRAPLRAIDGFAHKLEMHIGKDLDAEGRRLLDVVLQQSARMADLITALLTFSRLGRQALRTQAVQLDELVKEVLADLRSDCEGRQIDFTVCELGTVEADRVLLKQAILNLLGNAIKFTRHTAEARIRIDSHQDLASGETVYRMQDNGAGFDMTYANKLFGVFQRLHDADEFEGTGVGLSIVQKVIKRHGGRVWAEAKPGEGATFFFTLPGVAAMA